METATTSSVYERDMAEASSSRVAFTLPTLEQLVQLKETTKEENINELRDIFEQHRVLNPDEREQQLTERLKQFLQENEGTYQRIKWITNGVHLRMKLPMFRGCLFRPGKQRIQSVDIPRENSWKHAMIMKLLEVTPVTGYTTSDFYFRGKKYRSYFRREQRCEIDDMPQFWPTNKLLIRLTDSDIQGPVLIVNCDDTDLDSKVFTLKNK